MRFRRTEKNGEAIGLFPFLAVLLCTMGALLVLLVVLSQHIHRQAAQAAARVAAPATVPTTAAAHDPTIRQPPVEADVPQKNGSASEVDHDEDNPQSLSEKLAIARVRKRQFDALRAEADRLRQEEQMRLSHLEEHTRRLEHELAQLEIAHQRLVQTEQQQSVDHVQAQRELAHLRRLAEDTEKKIETLRQEAKGKKSYAIVPYRGPHGTARRPLYIECTRDGVVLQPENIRLTAEDFLNADRAGNPLASAIRAAREYLTAQAKQRGETDSPDPYPLLLVRPHGTAAYAAALAAIRSFDTDFGYEFVEDDWDLDFAESDPLLAETMYHAVLQAREREEMLAQLAPSRYARVSGTTGRGDGGTARGAGLGGAGESAEWGNDAGHRTGASRTGSDSRVDGRPAGGDRYGQSVYGAASSGAPQEGAGDSGDSQGANPYASLADAAAQRGYGTDVGGTQSKAGNVNGAQQSEASTGSAGDASASADGGAGTGQAALSNGAPAAGGSSAAAGQTSPTYAGQQGGASGANSPNAGGPSIAFGGGKANSLARKRGSDWAIDADASASSSPVRRPIQAVIHPDHVSVLPNRHAVDRQLARGTEVSFDQPAETIADQLVQAMRDHMQDWGIAGRGLYWRPVLDVYVTPGAEAHASELARLFEGSGIDVQLPATAQRGAEATRRGAR